MHLNLVDKIKKDSNMILVGIFTSQLVKLSSDEKVDANVLPRADIKKAPRSRPLLNNMSLEKLKDYK